MDTPAKDRPGAEKLGIGEALRHAREQRGLTLDAAAQGTRIRLTHLLALEEEDFAELPAPVFARGLLRTYASYLGLNADELTAILDSRRLLVSTPRVQSEVPRRLRGRSSLPRLLAVCVVVGLFGTLGYYLYDQYRAFLASEASVPVTLPTPQPAAAAALFTPEPTLAPSPAPTQPTALPTQPPEPTPTPLPTPTPTPQRTVTVEASFSGACWVQVWVDDVEVLHNWTARAGDRRIWTGKKVYLWVGNAGVVDIIYNGKPQGRLGANGQAVKVTWTAQ